MAKHLKSRIEEVIELLKKDGKVEIIDQGEKILDSLNKVEKELDDYRFENQKRILESQEDIANVVLTS